MRALIILAALLAGCARNDAPAPNSPAATSAKVATLPGAHPLSIAARDAASACFKVDAPTIEDCGTTIPGNTEEHKAARKAVRKAFEARDAFMSECQAGDTLAHCTADAEMHIMRGYALLTE